ncbi:MAG: hypothetical protein FWE60_04600, partial [Oscillospiraceae bacterium]|nr:hypothetical protein [Oscillospiraceae bacterium]
MKKLKKIVSVIIVIAVVAGFAAVPMTANTSVNDAKDLLQAFVTQCKTNITQAILNDSGSTGSKNYTRALMYSETVLSKGSATVEEYITAYYMLRTASSEEHLYTRTWEELTALHESVKPIFDSQNRLHADDDGSQKYTPLTYTRFSAAYEEKTHIQTWQQGQKQYITDVYDRLEFAVDNLIENEIVSKTDFHELRVKLQNLAIMERNRFTDERRPRNFDRDHDHINILNYHELIGFFRSCADCEDKEAADGSIDGGARWGTAWLWYDFYHTAFFTASPIIWDLTTNETTSHFTVVNSYLNMQIIYDYITWFLTNADQYQQATLSNYKTLMDQYHDLIVNADNGLRSLTDDPEEFDAFVYLAAERNPRDGIGALAALYAQIED